MSPSERQRRARDARAASQVPRQDMLKRMVGTAFMRVLMVGADGDVVAQVLSEIERMSVEGGFDPVRVADRVMEGK